MSTSKANIYLPALLPAYHTAPERSRALAHRAHYAACQGQRATGPGRWDKDDKGHEETRSLIRDCVKTPGPTTRPPTTTASPEAQRSTWSLR